MLVRATTSRVRPAWAISAICTFSTTDMERKVCATWKVRPTPMRHTARGGRPVMSCPLSVTRPVSGRSCPPTMLKVVDLPAPFGPMIASISPADNAKVTSFAATTPPKRLLSPSAASSVMRV